VISVDCHAVMARPRDAVDRQLAAAVGADVREGDYECGVVRRSMERGFQTAAATIVLPPALRKI
jgi:hypothetical protein